MRLGDGRGQMTSHIPRDILPIPDTPYAGTLPLDAKDPEASFPAIEPLRPPEGACLAAPTDTERQRR